MIREEASSADFEGNRQTLNDCIDKMNDIAVVAIKEIETFIKENKTNE